MTTLLEGPSSSELGSRLRAVRAQHELSLRQLASEVDCSASALSQVETGKALPSLSLLTRLAQRLHISLDTLLDLRPPIDPLTAPRSIDELFLSSLHLQPGELRTIGELRQRHAGLEFVYVVDGLLTLEVGSDLLTLAQGSSVRFDLPDSSRCINRSDRAVHAVWGQVRVRNSPMDTNGRDVPSQQESSGI